MNTIEISRLSLLLADQGMTELQTEKATTCTDCVKSKVGEYIVRKNNGKEEYYHPQCAKKAGVLQLPVQIRFTEGA